MSQIKLDLGCGTNKKPGFTGMDSMAFEGVDVVHDLRQVPWPFADGSVGEVHCSHVLEHLTGAERCLFFDELWRVLAPGGKALIITPHWSHESAYGDPTHQWPPVCGQTYFFTNRAWRDQNAPHVPMHCNFDCAFRGVADPKDPFVQGIDAAALNQRMTRNINTFMELVCQMTRMA